MKIAVAGWVAFLTLLSGCGKPGTGQLGGARIEAGTWKQWAQEWNRETDFPGLLGAMAAGVAGHARQGRGSAMDLYQEMGRSTSLKVSCQGKVDWICRFQWEE